MEPSAGVEIGSVDPERRRRRAVPDQSLRFGDRHAIQGDEPVDLFLHATNVGLFDMDWLIICGACANVFRSFRQLESLDPHFVCNLCSMVNEADLDDFIQVTFTISPRISVEIRNVGSDRASVWVVGYPRTKEMAFVEFVPVLSAKRLISNQTFRRPFDLRLSLRPRRFR